MNEAQEYFAYAYEFWLIVGACNNHAILLALRESYNAGYTMQEIFA